MMGQEVSESTTFISNASLPVSPETSKCKSQSNSGRIFRAVRDAVHISNTFSPVVSSTNATPTSNLRSHSLVSHLSGKTRISFKGRHPKNCKCSACHGWLSDEESDEDSEKSDKKENDDGADVCMLSDGPTYIFKEVGQVWSSKRFRPEGFPFYRQYHLRK